MKVLRIAEAKDWEALDRICRQVLTLQSAWSPGEYEVVEHPYPMEYLLEDIQDQCLYTAKIQNVLVGYVRFRIWETNGAGSLKRKMFQIEDIGVEETLRHQGIGKAMMADLKELACELGCTDMKLYVDAKNESAFTYYQSCGFQVSNIGMHMKL